MVVLDTDLISLLKRRDQPSAARLYKRVAAIPAAEKASTIISYEEQCRGWMGYLARAKRLANQIEAYDRLLYQLKSYCAIAVLSFDERAAVEFQRLKQSTIRVGTMDLKIAAITRNLQDLIEVPA